MAQVVQLTNTSRPDRGDAKDKIYVACCDEDLPFAESIVVEIEANGLECYFRERDGKTVPDLGDFCRQSKSCRLVLFICTGCALKDPLIMLLQIQSLLHTVESKQLTLMFLLHGIEEKDLPAEVKFVPHVCTWEEDYEKKLMVKLKAPNVSLSHLLPVGNISSGLVRNYFFGYLKLILPVLPKRIDDWMSSNPSKTDTMSKRLYLLLPKDTKLLPKDTNESLCDAHKSIEFVETFETKIASRAGVIGRSYKNTIYKFRKDDKEYHVVAEYATPLETMAKIKDGKIAGLTDEAFRKQFELFKEKLKEEDLQYCTLVIYDKEQSLPEILAKEIENDLKGGENPPTTTQQESQSAVKQDQSYEDQPDVYISYCDEDKGFAEEIMDKIEREGLRCYFKDRDAGSGYILDQLCEKSHNCRQILCIYSEDTLKHGTTKYILFSALQFSGDPEELNVTFLLRGFQGEIPPELEGLHHFREDDDDNFKELMYRLKDKTVKMKNLLPVGDIYIGLAWSFYYGYLDLVLPEIRKKIDEWVEEAKSSKYQSIVIQRRLYILLPTNGRCPNSLEEKDDCIERVDTFTTLKTDRAGNKGREYQNTVYKISKPEREYYIVVEFSTAMKIMHEMMSECTGLTESTLKKQANLFKEKLSEILSHKDVPHECCTLVICDDTQRLSDLLIEKIEKEEKRMKDLEGITEKIKTTGIE